MGYKHGRKGTRLYRIWQAMKTRCHNAKSPRYSDYGARGIVVCEEWRNDFQNFYDWAMENGYSDKLTIDRIDNDKSYSPDNCRWSTIKIQNRNSRHNKLLTLNNETHCLTEWAEITGLTVSCICNRIRYGWKIEDVLTKPRGYNVGLSKSQQENLFAEDDAR